MDEQSIFSAALERDNPSARAAFLDSACGGDPALRKRLEKLIGLYEQAGSFLEPPIAALSAKVTYEPVLERHGTVIGPYKLLEQIGEGGVGLVYMAEQQRPVRRRVALKIIKPGMDTQHVIARFEAERQALALMDHPNIARVLDAGATETGRPYFVMELVRGIPITEYCDRTKLTTRQRLELFVAVCRAVQHAHQKGIIHRDLKSSNVMVTLHDGTPVPKVIDFGVAKAISHQLTERTLFTHFAQMVGTPLYMSPEQAEFCGLDVDTRSDVYSLGVLLYELLTGSTPFDKETLKTAGYDEMRRIICEQEPPKPSACLSTLQARALSTLSDQRGTDPRKLRQLMHGDLDWIVMKALEKDRTRRYDTANGLAMDIKRYLNDEPVTACPPSAAYRLRKFARRNKTTIATTGLVATALIIGTSVSIWQALEANDARQLADQRFFEADRQRQSAVRAAKQAQQNEEFSRQLVYAADVKLAAQAWQSGDVGRFTDLLDRHTQIAGKTDRRGFEWSYLRQFGMADFRNIATQTGGSCVARYSRDGKYLATGRHDGTICVWDGGSYQQLATWHGHEDLVRGIDFASDGNRMASIGDDGMIRLWDLSRGKEIRAFRAHDGHGYQVFFALGGTILVSHGEKPAVKLWNSATGEPLGQLEARRDSVKAMDVSPDGRLCVAGDRIGITWVWDLETRTHIARLKRMESPDWARCLGFAPDGRLVAAGTAEKRIRICDSRTGKLVATFVGHEDDIQDVAFHPTGGWLASSDKAGVIRVWRLNSVREVVDHDFGRTDKWPPYFRGHSARAWSLDFSPDGSRLISASNDGNVRSWTGRRQTRQHIGDTDDTIAITFISHGSELLIAGEHDIRIWNRQADEIRPFGATFNEKALCAAVSPDGETCVTGHYEGIIRFWSRQTGRLKKTLTAHEDYVLQLTFSPDGTLLATASWDGSAKLWDTASGEHLAVFDMPPHCRAVAFSPDGKLLACSSEDDAMLFDVASRKRLHLLQGHQNTADCVTFSPDGRLLATGSHDRTIRIWSVATGEVKHVIAAHRKKIYSLAFSPDGRTIASGDKKGTIAFSHVRTGQFLFDTKVGNMVRLLQFSPDGEILAATVDNEGVVLLHAPRIEDDET